MSKTLHFKRSEMPFEPYAGPPGNAEISRLVGTDVSKTMGGSAAA